MEGGLPNSLPPSSNADFFLISMPFFFAVSIFPDLFDPASPRQHIIPPRSSSDDPASTRDYAPVQPADKKSFISRSLETVDAFGSAGKLAQAFTAKGHLAWWGEPCDCFTALSSALPPWPASMLSFGRPGSGGGGVAPSPDHPTPWTEGVQTPPPGTRELSPVLCAEEDEILGLCSGRFFKELCFLGILLNRGGGSDPPPWGGPTKHPALPQKVQEQFELQAPQTATKRGTQGASAREPAPQHTPVGCWAGSN